MYGFPALIFLSPLRRVTSAIVMGTGMHMTVYFSRCFLIDVFIDEIWANTGRRIRRKNTRA
jgi:hypothetical protein